MNIQQKLQLWLLENRRDVYLRLKKLGGHVVASDNQFLDLHSKLLREDKATQTFFERYNLYSSVLATAKLPGAMAEAGVFRGGSAKLLCELKGDAPLYLFDTFEGLPQGEKDRDEAFGKGQFSETSLEEVKNYLAPYPNVFFYKGFFPASAVGQEPERQTYRFVHLDLDLYQSTLDALRFFHPRMVPGGIIISHDYNYLRAVGVRDAFQEYFQGMREPIIPLWDTQCLVVKI